MTIRRSAITTTAAIALVIQTAALTAGALYAGWRIHQFAATLTVPATTPTTTDTQPTGLRVVGDQ